MSLQGSSRRRVPRALRQDKDLPGKPALPIRLVGAAGVAWRLLVISGALLALVLVLNRLTIVVLPVFLALFLTALGHVPHRFLRRHRWPRAAATWFVLLGGVAILGGIGYFVASNVASNYAQLVAQVSQIGHQARDLLHRLPGSPSGTNIDALTNKLVGWLQDHRAAVAGGVITAGRMAAEIVTGLIIAVFLTYFFLADGSRLWTWCVRLLPGNIQGSANGAGHRAWRVLSAWILGTAVIAVFHGVVVGAVLWILGTPLVIPLAVLVFLGSFIPIVGAVLFGGLAVLVTLVAVGPISGLILVCVLLVENQIEAHLLQPFIVGRAVRLHPVAIVIALTGGGLLGGIFGAILAIPIVASAHAAVKYLTGVEDVRGRPRRLDDDRMRPEAPAEYAPLPIYAAPLAYPEPPEVIEESADSGDAATAHGDAEDAESPPDDPPPEDEPHGSGGKPLVESAEPDPDDE